MKKQLLLHLCLILNAHNLISSQLTQKIASRISKVGWFIAQKYGEYSIVSGVVLTPIVIKSSDTPKDMGIKVLENASFPTYAVIGAASAIFKSSSELYDKTMKKYTTKEN